MPSAASVRAVVDTNVLISGLLWRGPPYALIEKARTGTPKLVTSPELIAELERVLARPKFRIVFKRSGIDPRRLLREIARMMEVVAAPPLPRPMSRDQDDDRVLAAAIAGKADIIVSGDDDLLSLGSYEGIPILTPVEALRVTDV